MLTDGMVISACLLEYETMYAPDAESPVGYILEGHCARDAAVHIASDMHDLRVWCPVIAYVGDLTRFLLTLGTRQCTQEI